MLCPMNDVKIAVRFDPSEGQKDFIIKKLGRVQ
jgi:hypothetical protein